MMLKSSNKRTLVLLGGLIVLTLLFLSLKSIGKKPPKYLSAPEGIEQKTTLDFIQLTFNEKSYNKLKNKRDKALSVGILETKDTDYVPATITFNGAEYRAEVRLKGDWTDHLRGDKWSFRIKLKGDETIMGMRKFSIHHPKTRGHINEWLYHKAIKREDLMGLRYDFLEGVIHIKQNNSGEYINKKVGIYAIEESFDKRMIESNKRKESVILKFSEDKFWNNVNVAKEVGNPSGIVWKKFINYKVDLPITVFSESKVLGDSTMRDYFKIGKNLLEDLRSGNTTVDAVFDIKELAMQNAILNLFGASHGLALINVRFYYNPITSKLEPIAFDGDSGARLQEYNHFKLMDQKNDSVYLKELAYAIQKVSQPIYLDNLIQDYKIELSNYEKILKKEFRVQLFKEDNFRSNQEILKKELVRLKKIFKLDDIEIDTGLYKTKERVNNLDISLWKKRGIILSKTSQKHLGNTVYKIERENTTKGSYVIITDINAERGKLYEATILIKKGDIGGYFGLRIQGQYRNRVDAVFDLKEGKLKGGSKTGNFSFEGADIVPQKNGWYKLTIKVRPDSAIIKFVFGPTNNTKEILYWETPTNDMPNSYIDISSVKLIKLN